MDLLLRIANLLYLAAYFVCDVLWLRVLSLVGASCLALYFHGRPGLAPVVYWNLLFAGLNLYWAGRLAAERAATRHALARLGHAFRAWRGCPAEGGD